MNLTKQEIELILRIVSGANIPGAAVIQVAELINKLVNELKGDSGV